MLEQLPYLALKTPPKTTAFLKTECADFIVKEYLGYEMSGEGEFVALYVRKTDCNTLFVGEKLAKFAGVSERNMGYAGVERSSSGDRTMVLFTNAWNGNARFQSI